MRRAHLGSPSTLLRWTLTTISAASVAATSSHVAMHRRETEPVRLEGTPVCGVVHDLEEGWKACHGTVQSAGAPVAYSLKSVV